MMNAAMSNQIFYHNIKISMLHDARHPRTEGCCRGSDARRGQIPATGKLLPFDNLPAPCICLSGNVPPG